MQSNISKSDIKDINEIQALYFEAFTDEAREVANVAKDIVAYPESSEVVSLVYKINQMLLGHIAFSQVRSSNNEDFKVFILAPLVVKKSHQREGIGSLLVHEGINQLKAIDADAICVYGNPEYYSKFGFNRDIADTFIPPYKITHPHGWQVRFLSDKSLDSEYKFRCLDFLNKRSLW